MSRARSSSRYRTSERAPYRGRAASIEEPPLKMIGSLFRNQSPDPDNIFDTDVPQRQPKFEDEVREVFDSMKAYETKLKQQNKRWERAIGNIATVLTVLTYISYLYGYFTHPPYYGVNKKEMQDAISSLMFDLHRVPNMTIITTHPRTGIDRYLEGSKTLSLLSQQVGNSSFEFKNKVTPFIDDAASSIEKLSSAVKSFESKIVGGQVAIKNFLDDMRDVVKNEKVQKGVSLSQKQRWIIESQLHSRARSLRKDLAQLMRAGMDLHLWIHVYSKAIQDIHFSLPILDPAYKSLGIDKQTAIPQLFNLTYPRKSSVRHPWGYDYSERNANDQEFIHHYNILATLNRDFQTEWIFDHGGLDPLFQVGNSVNFLIEFGAKRFVRWSKSSAEYLVEAIGDMYDAEDSDLKGDKKCIAKKAREYLNNWARSKEGKTIIQEETCPPGKKCSTFTTTLHHAGSTSVSA